MNSSRLFHEGGVFLRSLLAPAILLRDFLLTLPVLVLVFPLWFLPRSTAFRLGRAYGHVACGVWGTARRVGMMNLRRAYGPRMTFGRARQWIWRVFGNLGQSVAEAIQFLKQYRNPASDWEGAYEAENPEFEKEILRDPRPKVFVAGHLGSWEVTWLIHSLRVGHSGAAVAPRVDNPFLNWFVRRARLRYGSRWIEKRGASIECLRSLEAGNSVALIMDENAGYRGLFIDFFGRPASTQKTAAVLSLQTGVPVVLGAAIRRPDAGRFLYKLAVLEPQSYSRKDDPVLALTRDIVNVHEQWTREHPLQWRWIHWRWKTRPDGTEECYSRRDLRISFSEQSPADASA